eukprot:6449314-Prorocentrum_lima.AAC.1
MQLQAMQEVWQAADAKWVRLDKDEFLGLNMLVHTRTCEQHALPAGDWSLHDLGGYAALVNTDAMEEGEWARHLGY